MARNKVIRPDLHQGLDDRLVADAPWGEGVTYSTTPETGLRQFFAEAGS